MESAVGMIETTGIVAALTAADAMLKAGKVELIGREQVGGGIITVVIRGDVGAVEAATSAAAQAVRSIGGQLIAVHVIARPHPHLDEHFPTTPSA
jgi:ethanolamine utilization protein EutM